LTVQRTAKAAKRYYQRHPAGGSLHIVLDDGNIHRGNVEDCLKYAVEEGDAAGAFLARAILRMTISQRRRLTSAYGAYCY
jgi:hypothetical protein